MSALRFLALLNFIIFAIDAALYLANGAKWWIWVPLFIISGFCWKLFWESSAW